MGPIRKADIARHWKVSPAYVTILLRRRRPPGGPDITFLSLEEADAWRAVNAPPNPASEIRRQSSSKIGVDDAEKKSRTQNHPPQDSINNGNGGGNGGIGGGDASGGIGGGAIDINALTGADTDVDFDTAMIRHAEAVPRVAYGLYIRACAGGNAVEIANATRNWAEATKQAAVVRERFLAVQEKSRALIPLDLVMDIVGNELQPLRSLLLTLDERCAVAANPADPAQAKAAIRNGVDDVFRAMSTAEKRIHAEVTLPASAA